ncbi:class I SAM-dependent methyltransferase [Nocardiopsis alborubida]|uniref:Class I SAM-dependent methyltransferase n=1 Tax=Nocardiopsis alborubida TaxID=146802 RepID=A0A7X6M8Q8_9ACTN|nr:class I SAM-dependent methyltransferase [Nocardiopsis alborubida]NKY96651.1 class I SAM-dependent methyltransferase [Nocardiopsis alborubida]
MPEQPPTTHAWISAPNPRLYSLTNLNRYGRLIVDKSHRLAWKLDNAELLDLYLRHVSDRHLEIGPADMHFLSRTPAPAMEHQWRVDVLDINEAPLNMARERLAGRARVGTHQHDVLATPWPLSDQSVGSLACGNVLHCVPGKSFAAKATAIDEMSRVLNDTGVAWGYTLLGAQDPALSPNLLARYLMYRYNRADNVFHNIGDRLTDLSRELDLRFTEVRLWVMGCAAVWAVRGPRR